jgi:hypothetical protein
MEAESRGERGAVDAAVRYNRHRLPSMRSSDPIERSQNTCGHRRKPFTSGKRDFGRSGHPLRVLLRKPRGDLGIREALELAKIEFPKMLVDLQRRMRDRSQLRALDGAPAWAAVDRRHRFGMKQHPRLPHVLASGRR